MTLLCVNEKLQHFNVRPFFVPNTLTFSASPPKHTITPASLAMRICTSCRNLLRSESLPPSQHATGLCISCAGSQLPESTLTLTQQLSEAISIEETLIQRVQKTNEGYALAHDSLHRWDAFLRNVEATAPPLPDGQYRGLRRLILSGRENSLKWLLDAREEWTGLLKEVKVVRELVTHSDCKKGVEGTNYMDRSSDSRSKSLQRERTWAKNGWGKGWMKTLGRVARERRRRRGGRQKREGGRSDGGK